MLHETLQCVAPMGRFLETGKRDIVQNYFLEQQSILQLVKKMKRGGVQLAVRSSDVTRREEAEKLILECNSIMPPIKGPVHGAMALWDGLFETMTFEDWPLKQGLIINVALHSHQALSSANLAFFVMLASLSGLVGGRDQAAYTASKTFLDACAAFGIQQGVAASMVDIRIVEKIGYVAEDLDKS